MKKETENRTNMHAKLLQPCLTLCSPMDRIAHQAPLSVGILQAEILECISVSFSNMRKEMEKKNECTCMYNRITSLYT